MENRTIKTGAELFCEALIAEGVDLMFGIPGGVVLPLYDKLNRYDRHIRHILPRHEQGGGFAADAYARVTGKVGVALGTSGPGATNLLTAITNSMMDSVPVVYITGQVVEEFIGTDAFQEADVIGMTMPVVKHSYLVNKAADIPRVLKEAFFIANTGRPGPVHVDLVKDVWFEEVAVDTISSQMYLPGYKPFAEPLDDSLVLELDNILSRPGVKPVIIAGHGVEIARGQDELVTFAERHNIPVVSTLLGLSNFPQAHPLWLGMLGMHGDAVANFAVHDANLVIGIGCRFDDRIIGKLEAFIDGKTFVHFEIDHSEIGKTVPTELGIHGDLKEILLKANELLVKHEFPDWWGALTQLKQKYGFLDYTLLPPKKDSVLHQSRIMGLLSDITNGESIVTADVGRHQMWVGRFYRFKNGNSHISSGGLGSMGYGLPAAMGAKLAAPNREVWSINGDGGFMMNLQELGALSEYNIGVKVAIMEDSNLGMVRQWQNLLFKGNRSHSEFKNPDFVKLAESFGIPAWRARNYQEAEEAIIAARKIDGPTLITFMVDPDEHVYPMVPPATPLGNQALSDEDFLFDNNKYNDDELLQGHT